MLRYLGLKIAMTGKFIVFEGLDGAGKTLQSKLLSDYLLKTGNKVLLTKEPTSQPIGLLIKKILYGIYKVDPITETFLFAADRFEHLKNEIIPALNQESWVISDRYYFTSVAYQGAKGVDINTILTINSFAKKPDLIIYLDIDAKKAVSRIKNHDNFEKLDFLEKVRENYLDFFSLYKEKDLNIIFIDGNKSINQVAKQIRDDVKAWIFA
ncbi:MAG: dTMP kinase [Methanosarcinales archaeon]